MFPDFPSLRNAYAQELNTWAYRQIFRISPILGEVNRHTVHEGESTRFRGAEGNEGTIPLTPHEFQVVFEREQLRRRDPELLLEKFLDCAKYFAEQATRKMFQQIENATEQTGNVIDGKGLAIEEQLLRMLEKLEISFDRRTGDIHWPTAVAHPSQEQKLSQAFARLEHEPFRERFQRLIQEKREGWRAREGRRKLVD